MGTKFRGNVETPLSSWSEDYTTTGLSGKLLFLKIKTNSHVQSRRQVLE